MKFNLNTDKIEDLKLTFSDEEYEKDIADIVADFSYGMGAFFIDFAVKLDCDTEQARTLKDVFISCMGRNIDNILDRGVLDADDEADDLADEKKEQTLYEMMEQIFDEWYETECSYNDRDELLQDVIKYNCMPTFLYNEEDEAIDIILEPDDTHFFCSFSETLGSIPLDLYRSNRVRAESTALTYQFIATVLFDKAFGEEDNPLRADDFINFDTQLTQLIEGMEDDGCSEDEMKQEATSCHDVLVRDTLFEEIREIVARHTGIQSEKILPTLTLSDAEGIDSLDVVEIIMDIEEEFDIVISDEVALRMTSINDILQHLEKSV